MTDDIRLIRVRFLLDRARVISKSAFKELVIELYCLGCLTHAEVEYLFRSQKLRCF